MMPTNPPRSHFVELPTRLRYHVLEWPAEAPNAPTVFLLHGFLDFARSWQFVVDAGLLGAYRLLAPDFRGHGESERVGRGGYYHFVDYLADLDGLYRHFDLPTAALVGHSMGGSVAGYFAGAFPAKVSHLVMLEGLGPPESSESPPERIANWITSWKRVQGRPGKQYSSLQEAAQRILEKDERLSPEMAHVLAEWGTQRSVDGGFAFAHDAIHTTTGPTLFRVENAGQFWQRITCPTLLVDGEFSMMRFSAEETARRVSYFKNAQFAMVENAGHMMTRHNPRRVAELIHTLLAG